MSCSGVSTIFLWIFQMTSPGIYLGIGTISSLTPLQTLCQNISDEQSRPFFSLTFMLLGPPCPLFTASFTRWEWWPTSPSTDLTTSNTVWNLFRYSDHVVDFSWYIYIYVSNWPPWSQNIPIIRWWSSIIRGRFWCCKIRIGWCKNWIYIVKKIYIFLGEKCVIIIRWCLVVKFVYLHLWYSMN